MNNTFTTIKGTFSTLQDVIPFYKNDSTIGNGATEENAGFDSSNASLSHSKNPRGVPAESNKEQEGLIPLYPRFVASVVRHWIMPSPSEGLKKTLVEFVIRDRNGKKSKDKTSLKQLYDKRKTVGMAFCYFTINMESKNTRKSFGLK